MVLLCGQHTPSAQLILGMCLAEAKKKTTGLHGYHKKVWYLQDSGDMFAFIFSSYFLVEICDQTLHIRI